MWLAGCKASLYIATNLVSLDRVGHARQVWADQPWDVGLRAAANVLQEDKHRKVSVWVSGGLARPFLIPPTQGLKRWRDVVQLAEGLGPRVTQQDVPLNVWIGRWRGDEPSLAVATEQKVIDSLMALKVSHGVRVRTITPVWHWVVEQDTHNAALILVNEDDACTGLQLENGKPAWVVTHCPPPQAGMTSALMARTAFSQNVEAEAILMGLVTVSRSTQVAPLWQRRRATPPFDLSWKGVHSHAD